MEFIDNNCNDGVIKSASNNIPTEEDKAIKLGTDNMEGLGIDTNQINRHGQCKDSTTLISTIAYICTTQGKLLAISLPTSVSQTFQNVVSHNEDINISTEDDSLPVLWDCDVGAPIFSSPLVTSTVIATERTERTALVPLRAQQCTDEEDQSLLTGHGPNTESLYCHDLEEKLHLLRTDTVIFGVVDGTVRCLSIRSRIPIADKTLLSLSGLWNTKDEKFEEGRKMRGVKQVNLRGEGEEIWRVSFASKPVFTSICSIDNHQVRNHFTFQLSLSPPSLLSVPSIINGRDNFKLSTSVPFELSSIDNEENSVEKRVIIFGSHDGHIRGISSYGDLLWETDLGSIIFSSPCVVVGTSLVVAATTAGIVYVLDCGSTCSSINSKVVNLSTYQSKSQQSVSHSVLGPDVTCNKKDFSSSKGKSLGAIVAHTRLQGEIFSSPVVYKNMIYIGCRDDKVHAIAINIENHPY